MDQRFLDDARLEKHEKTPSAATLTLDTQVGTWYSRVGFHIQKLMSVT